MYCWDRQSSSRCPWSLIRTQRHFPFNSLHNLISSATLTLCFTEYFESTFPCVFLFWAFKGENRAGSLIALGKSCLLLVPSADPPLRSSFCISTIMWTGPEKQYLLFPTSVLGKLTQLDFPHNYSIGCTFLLITRNGIINIDHRCHPAWQGSHRWPRSSWASQKASWSQWPNPANSHSTSQAHGHSEEWLVLQFTHWCFIYKLLLAV